MPNETLTHDQASRLYERLSREAAARNARACRLRIVARSGVAVALLTAAIGAGFATNWGRQQQNSPYPTLHPTKSTASAEAIRKAGRYFYGQLGPGWSLVWEPPLKSFGFGHAIAVSLADAKARATFPVAAPSSVLPDDSILKVWYRGRGYGPEVVAIEYEHLEILEESESPAWDGPAAYRRMVRLNPDPGASIGTIQGATAYIAPPYTGDDGIPHPGYIVFMKGDVQITVIGYYPVDELIEIANSIK